MRYRSILKSSGYAAVFLFSLMLPWSIFSDESTLINTAQKAIKAEKYEYAQTILSDLITTVDQEKKKKVYLLLGDSFLGLEEYKEAFECYQAAYRLDPNNAELKISYASALIWMGRYEEAESIYSDILKNDRHRIDVAVKYSQLFLLQQKNRKALSVIEKLLQSELTDQQKIDLLLVKAQALLWVGEYKKSIGTYLDVLTLDQGNQDVLLGLSFAYVELGDYLTALEWNTKLLSQDKKNIELWSDRAMIFESVGDIDSALKVYDMILKIDPFQVKAMSRRVMLLSWQDRTDEATKELERTLALRGGNVETYLTLGRSYGWESYLDKVLNIYQSVLDRDPNNVEALINLGQVYVDLNRWSEAESLLERAVDLSPEDKQISDALDQLKKLKRPEIEYRHFSSSFKDYDTFDKRYFSKIANTSDVLRVVQPFDRGQSLEIRIGHNTNREEDLVNDEIDVQTSSNTYSVGYNRWYSENVFAGHFLEMSNHSQDGRSVFRLPEDKRFWGGYYFLSFNQGSFAHSLSFSRDSFIRQRVSPARSTVASLNTLSFTSEYDFNDRWKILGHAEQRDIEFENDRSESYLEVQYRPHYLDTVTFGMQYEYISHQTESITEFWFKRYASYFDDSLYTLIEGRVSFDEYNHVWNYQITPTVSYDFFENFRLVAEYDYSLDDGQDRDEFSKFEMFLSYKF